MSAEQTTSEGQPGDVYCRPTTWLDVAKFMLLNYVLHAATVIPEPGGGVLLGILGCVTAIVFPLFGVDKAISRISGVRKSKDPLSRAKRSGALCMVVPKGSHLGDIVIPAISNIHGSFPAVSSDSYSSSLWKAFLSRRHAQSAPDPLVPYDLVAVPTHFTVEPISPEGDSQNQRETDLASNTAVMKSLAALAQICYGSFELYAASERQISRLGYAAYALTVIPYVLMSFMNLLSSLCCPNYPSLYLVYYRGVRQYITLDSVTISPLSGQEAASPTLASDAHAETVQLIRLSPTRRKWIRANEVSKEEMNAVEKRIIGAVGCAYSLSPEDTQLYELKHKTSILVQTAVITCTGTLLYILPYVITYILTGYSRGDSTYLERAIIVSSLTLSQVFYIIFGLLQPSRPRLLEPTFKYTLFSRSFYMTGTRDSFGPSQIEIWLKLSNMKRVLIAVLMLVAISPSICGFVMVGRMILEDNVCVKL